MATKSRQVLRKARHTRLRKRVTGTTERPRLAVYRSLKHISVQLIDDTKGVTLASASTQEKGVKAQSNVEGAKKIGELIAQRAKGIGISSVVFDRGGYRYHGTIASLADSAREAGLEF